jgi:hypothetical protein
MNNKFLKDGLGWGSALWFIGYVLGIALYPVIPSEKIGWYIMPIGVLITLWVLLKKIKGNSFQYYLRIAVTWTVIAIVFDYLFLVLLFKPKDGYYKLDVYLYYLLTFVMPCIAVLRKK